MKSLLFVCFALMTFPLWSQSPAAFSYQGVARNADNSVLGNQSISIQATILRSVSGPVVFSERHQAATGELGIFQIGIGRGNPIFGTLDGVDWKDGPYFLKIDLDPSGGTNFSPMGTTQLLSVPYALHAQTVSNDDDPDPANELQHLTHLKSGDTVFLQISDGQGTNVNVADADADTTNELQDITFSPIDDPALDNSTAYQVELTGRPPVLMPIRNYWQGPVPVGNISGIEAGLPVAMPLVRVYDSTHQVWIRPDAVQLQSGSSGESLLMAPAHLRFQKDSGAPDSLSVSIDRDDLGGWNSEAAKTVFLEWAPWGRLQLNDENGRTMSQLTRTSAHNGSLIVYGPNGTRNAEISAPTGFPNQGYIQVLDHQGVLKAGLFVNSDGQGQLFADVKNFRMTHPGDPEKEIFYASLEGPEVAAYERGNDTLENGRAFVPFSAHFSEIIDPGSLTVHLTPRSHLSRGLAVTDIRENGFVVMELENGKGNYSFFWEVKAVRKGFESYQVVRKKDMH